MVAVLGKNITNDHFKFKLNVEKCTKQYKKEKRTHFLNYNIN